MKGDWDEERNYRSNAVNGSAKLRDAILRALHVAAPVVWFDPQLEGRPMLKQPPAPKKPRAKRRIVRRVRRIAVNVPVPEWQPDPLIERIKAEVCEHFMLHRTAMTTARRAFAHPRQVAMFLSREVAKASLPSIGRHFRRDHTTVIHACRVVPVSAKLLDAAEAILRKLVDSGDNPFSTLRNSQENATEQGVNNQEDLMAA